MQKCTVHAKGGGASSACLLSAVCALCLASSVVFFRCCSFNTTRGSTSNCECSRSLLEDEAAAAIREISFAVRHASVSEMLPRTEELLFLNLTSLEGQCYCIELTVRGWRIASHRHDCMNGDFRQLNVHVAYFESIQRLMDCRSPEYRNKFAASLISKLNEVQMRLNKESGEDHRA